MKLARLALLLGLALPAAMMGCARGDSIVVTGEGKRLSSEAIDKDPFALLPSQPIALASLKAEALFTSPFGAEMARLAAQQFPLGQEAGIVPERDIRNVVIGFYAISGIDTLAIVSGDFSPELIARAAEAQAITPLGVPLVRSRYAGNELYTAGNIGISLLTRHTMLVGSETAMRRAMDRIRDDRLERDLPPWMMSLVEEPDAPFVAAGDLSGRAPVAAALEQLPFLDGVQNFRIMGNFQPPGVNFAGALTYPDQAAANRGSATIQSLGQMAGLMNMFSVFGLGSPVRSLKSQVVENDVQFVMSMDGASFSRLLAEAGSLRFN